MPYEKSKYLEWSSKGCLKYALCKWWSFGDGSAMQRNGIQTCPLTFCLHCVCGSNTSDSQEEHHIRCVRLAYTCKVKLTWECSISHHVTLMSDLVLTTTTQARGRVSGDCPGVMTEYGCRCTMTKHGRGQPLMKTPQRSICLVSWLPRVETPGKHRKLIKCTNRTITSQNILFIQRYIFLISAICVWVWFVESQW